MKTRFAVLLLTLWAGTAFAGSPSLLGGKALSEGTAHVVGGGWPSLLYEWWHSGAPEWGIGGELVYGDWSGEFSDVTIGGALNVPVRWHLSGDGSGTDMALQMKPGFMVGDMGGGRDGHFVFGLRAEMSLPVTIALAPRVNLITGGAIPFSVLFIDGADDRVVLPLLARIGAEVKATKTTTPWLLFELGPAFAFGDFDTQTEFAFRIWVGTSFK